jgi:outer membrane protein assembly factor BamA
MTKTLAVFSFLILFICNTFGQADSVKQKRTFIPVPLVYLTPETNWAFGGAVLFVIPSKHVGIQPTQIQGGAVYTLNKQILTYASFRNYSRKWLTHGEIGFYKYAFRVYDYDLQNKEKFEVYDVNFPRIRMHGYRRIKDNIFAGLAYWMEDYDVGKIEEGGILSKAYYSGSDGSFVSGLGPVFIIENRDNILNPSRGWYAEGSAIFSNGAFGSSHDFVNTDINARYYKRISKSNILAVESYVGAKFGDTPFQILSQVGGNKRMRGYFEGQYRDKYMIQNQVELRHSFGKSRWGACVFVSHASISTHLMNADGLLNLYAYGLGARFMLSKKDKLNVRFDIAWGKNTSGTYLTIGEAF